MCVADQASFLCLFVGQHLKADLLARYGGVAPKMAEEAHALVIDQVWFLRLTEVLQPFETGIYVNCVYIFCPGCPKGPR